MNWIDHFTRRYCPTFPTASAFHPMSPQEKQRIAYSIAQFQRGESSAATDYLTKSETFAESCFSPFFHVESLCFIREENAHSNWLRQVMDAQGIPLVQHSWTDSIFRWVRRRADIGWSSRVLLTAEVVAQLYYPALKEATTNEDLRAVCDRIIQDEHDHIRFQIERIAEVERTHTALRRVGVRVLNYLLFAGTALVVWMEHRPVLGYSMSAWRYLKLAWARFNYMDAGINQALCNYDIQYEEGRVAATAP